MNYDTLKEKLIVIEKEMGILSAPLISRRCKMTLEMAMELKKRFYENEFKEKVLHER